MDLSSTTAAFCVALTFMLASSASDQTIEHKSAQQYGNSAIEQQVQLTLPLLPRKLNLHEEADVKSSTDKDIMLHKKLLESSSSDKKEEKVVKGTWREWVDRGPTKSEYFTMDYAWVRRRRPIHNKQIPFLP